MQEPDKIEECETPIIRRKPKYCPFCGNNNISVDLVPWPAYSAEDRGNTIILDEHQCTDCHGKSFWT